MTKFVKISLGVVGLVILTCSVLVSFATRTANKLVDDGNLAAVAGNQFAEQAGTKYTELFTDANLEGFPANREQLIPVAQSLAELMEKSAEQYDLAAESFEKASQEGVKEVLKEYWLLKVQSFRKFAESKRTFRTVALLIPDEGVTDIDVFNEQMSPLIDEALKLDTESKELAAQGEKLRSENSDSFN